MNKSVLSFIILTTVFMFAISALILQRFDSGKSANNMPSATVKEVSIDVTPVPLTDSIRNPFKAPVFARKSVVTTKQPVETTPLVPVPFKLNAILPGPKPLAILQYGNRTSIVGQGESIWEATIMSITDQSVLLRYRGHEHVLQP